MKAVVLNKPREISIEAIPEPELLAPTDVLLRFTSTAICGTDLHIYEGRLGSGERIVIGHEPLGVVERVGRCGRQRSRRRPRYRADAHLLRLLPQLRTRLFGAVPHDESWKGRRRLRIPRHGRLHGCADELLRVPFGDANCLRLPGEPGDRGSTTSSCSPMRCRRLFMRRNSAECARATSS